MSTTEQLLYDPDPLGDSYTVKAVIGDLITGLSQPREAGRTEQPELAEHAEKTEQAELKEKGFPLGLPILL